MGDALPLTSTPIGLTNHFGILSEIDDRDDDVRFVERPRQVEEAVWEASKQGTTDRCIDDGEVPRGEPSVERRRALRRAHEGRRAFVQPREILPAAGLRRRGYTPSIIREFCRRIGVSKTDSRVEAAYLEDCVREELNKTSSRVMSVLEPLKVPTGPR